MCVYNLLIGLPSISKCLLPTVHANMFNILSFLIKILSSLLLMCSPLIIFPFLLYAFFSLTCGTFANHIHNRMQNPALFCEFLPIVIHVESQAFEEALLSKVFLCDKGFWDRWEEWDLEWQNSQKRLTMICGCFPGLFGHTTAHRPPTTCSPVPYWQHDKNNHFMLCSDFQGTQICSTK